MRERESGRRRSRTYLRTVRAEQVYACSPFPALPLNRTGFRVAVLGSSHSSKLFPPRPNRGIRDRSRIEDINRSRVYVHRRVSCHLAAVFAVIRYVRPTSIDI